MGSVFKVGKGRKAAWLCCQFCFLQQQKRNRNIFWEVGRPQLSIWKHTRDERDNKVRSQVKLEVSPGLNAKNRAQVASTQAKVGL